MSPILGSEFTEPSVQIKGEYCKTKTRVELSNLMTERKDGEMRTFKGARQSAQIAAMWAGREK